jgi:hypothetical protein
MWLCKPAATQEHDLKCERLVAGEIVCGGNKERFRSTRDSVHNDAENAYVDSEGLLV